MAVDDAPNGAPTMAVAPTGDSEGGEHRGARRSILKHVSPAKRASGISNGGEDSPEKIRPRADSHGVPIDSEEKRHSIEFATTQNGEVVTEVVEVETYIGKSGGGGLCGCFRG
ncbi:unnamed protein product [Amoebophrya sp. A25]|nr:unnamed protein product [Amoebophrya sp. A25]|eukprot:GSA25T00004945001.1